MHKNPKKYNITGFNVLIISLSLLFHLILFSLFSLFNPIKTSSPVKKKIFNLIDLKMGNTDQPKIPEPPQTKRIAPTPPSAPPIVPEPIATVPQDIPTQNIIPADTTEKLDTSNIQERSVADPTMIFTNSPVNTTASTPAVSGSQYGTVDAGAVGIKPVKLHSPDPPYPAIAQNLEISGKVSTIIVIDTNGFVESVKVIESPHKSMSDEVVKTLRKWKFKPVVYKGIKVSLRYRQDVEFNLDNNEF
jgi:protein TonB